MGKTMLNEMAPKIRCPRNKDCSIVQFIGGGGGNAALMQYKAGCGLDWRGSYFITDPHISLPHFWAQYTVLKGILVSGCYNCYYLL